MSRVFWDTNLFIYLFEDRGALGSRVAAMREQMLARGDELLTSAFTLGELLVKPTEAKQTDLCRDYLDGLHAVASIVAFDAAAAAEYARIRCDTKIKPPDALQLACAAAARTDLFVTNDDRLSRKIVRGIGFVSSLAHAPL